MAWSRQFYVQRARPAASRPIPPARLIAPVIIAAAAEDVEEAAALEPELPSPGKLSRFVHVAVKPLAFVHAGPVVMFDPDTKLTGAHLLTLAKEHDSVGLSSSYLVEYAIRRIINDLKNSSIASPVARDAHVL